MEDISGKTFCNGFKDLNRSRDQKLALGVRRTSFVTEFLWWIYHSYSSKTKTNVLIYFQGYKGTIPFFLISNKTNVYRINVNVLNRYSLLKWGRQT